MDRRFEERHAHVAIAVVAAGSFEYRTAHGRAGLVPGALLLGNAGAAYECSHEHAAGDRCVSFRFEPELFERIATDAGLGRGRRQFSVSRLPPLRALAPQVAWACAGLDRPQSAAWAELALDLAERALRSAHGKSGSARPIARPAAARASRAVRRIEADPAGRHDLESLAAEAGASPFHFLRCFRELTGATPHQFVLRARLSEAARRLAASRSSILDVAFFSGFGDVSNFNHAFRAEFGMSPREWRRREFALRGAAAAD